MTIPIWQARQSSRGLSTSKPASSSTTSSSDKTAASKSDKPLYASQSSLPHLPVPTISSTFAKYTETLQPLLTPEEFERSKSLIKEFTSSQQATTLQQRLEQRAKEKDSWLSEWWNETAYMGYRGRILPNVSYFYIHAKGLAKGKSQVERAAELVRAIVEFKKLVAR